MSERFVRVLADETEELCRAVPPRILEALRDYALNHHEHGHFVTAVLENNLATAVGRADDDSLAALPAIVRYAYNALPGPCWGSPEKVRAWLDAAPKEAP